MSHTDYKSSTFSFGSVYVYTDVQTFCAVLLSLMDTSVSGSHAMNITRDSICLYRRLLRNKSKNLMGKVATYVLLYVIKLLLRM